MRERFSVLASGGLLAAILASGVASAQSFPLTHELQLDQDDMFGAVHVEPDADGALVFELELDPERVGPDAAPTRVFFNLLPETSELWAEQLGDETPRRIEARRAHRKLARSGASFDWRVDVHPIDAAARRGPGAAEIDSLHRVRFRIFADGPLVVDDLLPVSMTRDGKTLHMVVTVKQGRTPEGDRVRWAGGVYEPPSEPPILN